MAIGKKVWFVRSLWENAIRVTIIRIEKDKSGMVSWIEAIDHTGQLYRDYPTKFTTGKTIKYC